MDTATNVDLLEFIRMYDQTDHSLALSYKGIVVIEIAWYQLPFAFKRVECNFPELDAINVQRIHYVYVLEPFKRKWLTTKRQSVSGLSETGFNFAEWIERNKNLFSKRKDRVHKDLRFRKTVLWIRVLN